MDTIFIKDLLVRGTIGLHEWERNVTQDILINVEFTTDTRKAGQSDNMDDSVNYRTICKRIINIAETSNPFLIETLINTMADTLLTEFKIEKIILSVEKPGALRFAKSVGIRVERHRHELT